MEDRRMSISKETFEKIVKRYDLTICGSADIEDAFCFVRDILEAEADAVRQSEPYATHTIDLLEQAARVVGGLEFSVSVDELCDMYEEVFR